MSNLEIAADKIAIMDVVYKYCRAIDRLDRELLESVFHNDSVHHHGAVSYTHLTLPTKA